MRAPKVEITLWRHVRYISGYPPCLAGFVDLGACGWVVDGAHDEGDGGVVEEPGEEGGVDVFYSVREGFYAVGDFGVEAISGAADCDEGVGVEEIQDAASCDLLGGVLVGGEVCK